MIKVLNLIFFASFFLPLTAMAQANDEDIFEANRLKKVFPDDRVAATLMEEEFNFDKARTDDQRPVVTAIRSTGINLIALRERASIQYFDFYNSFSRITSFKQLEKRRGM